MTTTFLPQPPEWYRLNSASHRTQLSAVDFKEVLTGVLAHASFLVEMGKPRPENREGHCHQLEAFCEPSLSLCWRMQPPCLLRVSSLLSRAFLEALAVCLGGSCP